MPQQSRDIAIYRPNRPRGRLSENCNTIKTSPIHFLLCDTGLRSVALKGTHFKSDIRTNVGDNFHGTATVCDNTMAIIYQIQGQNKGSGSVRVD